MFFLFAIIGLLAREITCTRKNIINNVTTFVINRSRRLNIFAYVQVSCIQESSTIFIVRVNVHSMGKGKEYCDYLIVDRVGLHCLKWVDVVNELLLSISFRDG